MPIKNSKPFMTNKIDTKEWNKVVTVIKLKHILNIKTFMYFIQNVSRFKLKSIISVNINFVKHHALNLFAEILI